MSITFEIEPIAEGSILVRFQHPADATLAMHIGQCAHDIMQSLAYGLMNVTPSYTTLLIDYLPYRLTQKELVAQLTLLLNHRDSPTTRTLISLSFPCTTIRMWDLTSFAIRNKGLH